MRILKKVFIVLAVLVLLLVAAYYIFPGFVFKSMIKMTRFSSGMQRHEISAANHNWVYLEGGSGETVVFLHGFGLSKDMWGSMLPVFSKSFRVIAPDLPGFGETGFNEGERYNCMKQADRFEEYVKKLGLNSFHLVGCSASGGISGYYTSKYPGRVKTLVLIGPFGVKSDIKSDYIKVYDKGENPLVFETVEGYDLAMSYIVLKTKPLPGRFKSFIAGEAEKTYDFYSREFKNEIDTEGWDMLRPYLGRIQAPTLVLFGDRDRVFDPSSAGIFKKGIKNVKTVIIKDAGHLTYMDKPDETNSAIIDFIKSNSKN